MHALWRNRFSGLILVTLTGLGLLSCTEKPPAAVPYGGGSGYVTGMDALAGFFTAYKQGNKPAARRFASSQVIRTLDWSPQYRQEASLDGDRIWFTHGEYVMLGLERVGHSEYRIGRATWFVPN